jgi:hypothetical protein
MNRAIILAVLAFVLYPHPGASAQVQGRRVLRGHVPPAVVRSARMGRLSSSKRLHLAIGLPLHNGEVLTNLLQDVYNPASPGYRQFLTPDQFTELFGPTGQEYQALIDFARTNGLTVTGIYGNRALLDVSGSVADIERVFRVTLGVYPHPTESRTFYAPDTEPSVPSGLPVLDISGLEDFTRPHPAQLKATPLTNAVAGVKTYAGSAGGNYIGDDFRAAYVPGVLLTGSGQAVGLFELDGYYPSDIASYESLAGLANGPVPSLQNVLVDGVSGNPGYSGLNGASTEVTLDIQMAIAMAPGLTSVIVYEGNSPNDVLNCMATNNQARQLNCSWGFTINATTETIFQRFAAQGQSFFQASGDSGAYTGKITTPSDDPYVTVVGGTSLSTSAANGPWSSETAWSGSGGGISTAYAIPNWQANVSTPANMGSATMRNIPDVAMVADSISIVSGGVQQSVNGTSAATPLWAAFTALVNQAAAAGGRPPVGFLNPALYAIGKGADYAACFHDITTGNNFHASSPARFPAVAGYDLCTGWGTPNGLNLITALATPDALGIMPGAGFSASGTPGGPFSPTLQSFTLTNSGAVFLDWSVLNIPVWLVASAGGGTLAPGGAVTVTVSLDSIAATLVPGLYSANLLFTNLTTGVGQYRQFTLTVSQVQLIQNGGFETGDFSSWILVGGTYPVNLVATANNYASPHSGTYVALLGQAGLPLGTLSQTLATSPGQPYLLSLWLNSPDGVVPNEFQVKWNGNILVDWVNMPALPGNGLTNLQFIVTAPGTSSVLQFGFRDDTSYLGLDDVTLVPVPAPVLWSGGKTSSTIDLTWNAMAGVGYQVQYKTNLAQANWLNLGGPIPATNLFLNFSDTFGANPQRFYRLSVFP